MSKENAQKFADMVNEGKVSARVEDDGSVLIWVHPFIGKHARRTTEEWMKQPVLAIRAQAPDAIDDAVRRSLH